MKNKGLSSTITLVLVLVAVMYAMTIPSFTEQVFSLKGPVIEKIESESFSVISNNYMNFLLGNTEFSLGVIDFGPLVDDKISVTHVRLITDTVFSKILI